MAGVHNFIHYAYAPHNFYIHDKISSASLYTAPPPRAVDFVRRALQQSDQSARLNQVTNLHLCRHPAPWILAPVNQRLGLLRLARVVLGHKRRGIGGDRGETQCFISIGDGTHLRSDRSHTGGFIDRPSLYNIRRTRRNSTSNHTYLRGLDLPRILLGDMTLRLAGDLIEFGVEVHLPH